MTDRVGSVAVDHDGVARPVNDTCPVCCKPIVGAETLHYTAAGWIHSRCYDARVRVHPKHCHDCGKPVDIGGDNARHTFRGWAHVNCLAENVRRVPRNVPPGGTHGSTDDLLEAIDEHLSTLCADDLDVVLGVVEGLRRARGHHGH